MRIHENFFRFWQFGNRFDIRSWGLHSFSFVVFVKSHFHYARCRECRQVQQAVGLQVAETGRLWLRGLRVENLLDTVQLKSWTEKKYGSKHTARPQFLRLRRHFLSDIPRNVLQNIYQISSQARQCSIAEFYQQFGYLHLNSKYPHFNF